MALQNVPNCKRNYRKCENQRSSYAVPTRNIHDDDIYTSHNIQLAQLRQPCIATESSFAGREGHVINRLLSEVREPGTEKAEKRTVRVDETVRGDCVFIGQQRGRFVR